uniref:Small ribosomal subunit protein uS8c n=1 Tax=Euglena anabaena TaxID=38273 RepID=A0A0G3FD66_EUGAN|nr:ribosomal protein S8 [Euglenaria anabaena]AKJ83357.1 ribosomal protein S8 [Euglenaria anabaena]
MSNIDLVSDMLTRIRNSNMRKSRTVIIKRTKLTLSIADILKKEGFIEFFEEVGDVILIENGFFHKYILITLKYNNGFKQKPYITHLKRISKPGLRVYVNKKIPKVLGGIGVAVLSTSLGLLTDRMSRLNKVGGEVLFFVW